MKLDIGIQMTGLPLVGLLGPLVVTGQLGRCMGHV